MSEIPKRDDPIYKEIESFEEYELTQCVAYEMAVRCKKNNDLIEEAVSFYYDNKEQVDKYFKYRKISNLDWDVYKHSVINNSKYYYLRHLIEQIDIINLTDLDTQIYKHPFIKKDFYEIVQDIIKDDFDDYTEERRKKIISTSPNKQIRVEEFDETTYLTYEKKRNGYIVNTTNSIECDEFLYYDENRDEYFEPQNIEDYNTIMQEKKDYFHTETEILKDFKRPELIIDKNYKKSAKVEIDFSMPLNEIIAFIKHIKDDNEKYNTIIAPIEMFNNELKKADNLVCNTKGKCFDSRSILSKQQKIADMFFIYDCVKKGITNQDIRYEVYGYYKDSGIKTITMDDKTLKKYKEIAFDYIDNMRYRELVTGVKIE